MPTVTVIVPKLSLPPSSTADACASTRALTQLGAVISCPIIIAPAIAAKTTGAAISNTTNRSRCTQALRRGRGFSAAVRSIGAMAALSASVIFRLVRPPL